MARTGAQRDLGQIEAQITMARDLLMRAETQLQIVGHDDSAAELKAIVTQLRRVRSITQERMADR